MSDLKAVLDRIDSFQSEVNKNLLSLSNRLASVEDRLEQVLDSVNTADDDSTETTRAILLVAPDADVTIDSALDAVTEFYERTETEWSVARDSAGFVFTVEDWWLSFEKSSLSLIDTIADSKRIVEKFAPDHAKKDVISTCATRYVVSSKDEDDRFDAEFKLICGAINSLPGTFLFYTRGQTFAE